MPHLPVGPTSQGGGRGGGTSGVSQDGCEARDIGAAFHPFVIESYGHFGQRASALLRSLSELRTEITPPSSLSESTLLSLAVTACSIAVQRGNAACYREGNVHARAAAAMRR